MSCGDDRFKSQADPDLPVFATVDSLMNCKNKYNALHLKVRKILVRESAPVLSGLVVLHPCEFVPGAQRASNVHVTVGMDFFCYIPGRAAAHVAGFNDLAPWLLSKGSARNSRMNRSGPDAGGDPLQSGSFLT